MNEEKSDLLSDLRAVHCDLFPYRHGHLWQPSDELLVLGVLMRREMELLRKIKQCPAGFAEGVTPQPSTRPRGRKGPTE